MWCCEGCWIMRFLILILICRSWVRLLRGIWKLEYRMSFFGFFLGCWGRRSCMWLWIVCFGCCLVVVILWGGCLFLIVIFVLLVEKMVVVRLFCYLERWWVLRRWRIWVCCCILLLLVLEVRWFFSLLSFGIEIVWWRCCLWGWSRFMLIILCIMIFLWMMIWFYLCFI